MESQCFLNVDDWLGRRLGVPAFHLGGGLKRVNEAPQALAAELRQAGLCFVDAKVPVAETGSAATLESLGFRLADTNLRFGGTAAGPAGMQSRRSAFARPDQADAVADLAGRAFVYDRFHQDPAISHSRAEAIKRDWARNFFAGRRGDWMVVAESQGRVAGFLQLLKGGEDLIIDLVAVDADFRGLGLARDMIAFAAASCGPPNVVVGTQVANLPSIALYQDLGLKLKAAQYVFHYHGTAP